MTIQTFSALETGASVRNKINANATEFDLRTNRMIDRFAFAGDSIAQLFGGLYQGSPFVWALASVPRRIDLDTAQGNFGVAGSTSGSTAGNMTNTTKMAAIAAYNPSILVIETGRNESGTGSTTTVDNIKTLVNYVITSQPTPRLRAVIVFPVLPGGPTIGTATSFAQTEVNQTLAMKGALHALARANPLYHIVDTTWASLDPVNGLYSPLGLAGKGVGAMSEDMVHPTVNFGRAIGWGETSQLNRILDTIGVERALPKVVARGDIYSASNIYGNCLGDPGSNGASVGTLQVAGGTTTAPFTGASPYGFISASDNAELPVTGTLGTSFTNNNGKQRCGMKLTFAATANLTANRAVSIGGAGAITTPLATSLNANVGQTMEMRLHVRKSAALQGLMQVRPQLTLYDGTNYLDYTTIMAFSNTTGANCDVIVSSVDEDYELVIPTIYLPTGKTYSVTALTIAANFRQGYQPVGDLFLSDFSINRVS